MLDFVHRIWLWLFCTHYRAKFQRNGYFGNNEWRSLWLCPTCGCVVYRRPVAGRGK